ncbi:B3 domain-containing protein Os11g0197600-like [Macadamia integrifolia]|uniref:B3 domain-containing protein Os11g0197600-like n=1 Tax=Macadamia integrifolia TaxID=60698 RepID=UPI001C4F4419|nr:B3 domain-containing protein Os11g0197600-like [Macadamia integrifolia]
MEKVKSYFLVCKPTVDIFDITAKTVKLDAVAAGDETTPLKLEKPEMGKTGKNIPPLDERPHFCKIMFPGFYTRPLRIPPEFLENISTEAYKFATLKDSNGNHWRVKLNKTTSGTYIEDGWQDFIRDHSIYDDNFLVFGYDGNTCFDVQIFDESGCNRDYLFSTKHQEPDFSNGAKECDKSSETSRDSVEKASKDDPGKCLPSSKPKGLRKAKGKDAVLTPEQIPKTIWSSSRRRPTTEEEKAKVLEEVESFTSKFPFLLRCLTATNVHKSLLGIPMDFARKHFHFQKKTMVTLWNKKGQAWKVNMLYTSSRIALCGGWGAFVYANQLEEGDICIFELVGKLEMQVHIFPAVKKVKFVTEGQI